jgi:hypothetical protein
MYLICMNQNYGLQVFESQILNIPFTRTPQNTILLPQILFIRQKNSKLATTLKSPLTILGLQLNYA